MTRRLTVAERHAAADKDLLLSEIAAQSQWSQFLVEQAVLVFGWEHDTFSANEMRDVLPDLGHGFLGAAINSLRQGGIIARVPGEGVPSTSPATHGHRLTVWKLSAKGVEIAAKRRAARRSAA
ncbi:hypothetical protein [Streptomyces sp. NPDC050428]|uniref:hypothetical protein n=1 Tax=Streptomyces sp. NPDC050428 TaxID=3155757 RepID=UPI00342748B9